MTPLKPNILTLKRLALNREAGAETLDEEPAAKRIRLAKESVNNAQTQVTQSVDGLIKELEDTKGKLEEKEKKNISLESEKKTLESEYQTLKSRKERSAKGYQILVDKDRAHWKSRIAQLDKIKALEGELAEEKAKNEAGKSAQRKLNMIEKQWAGMTLLMNEGEGVVEVEDEDQKSEQPSPQR